MTQRILDFSQNPVRLRMRMKQLVIQSEELIATTVPFEDIAVIVVSHPQVTFSQACIAELANNGGVLVVVFWLRATRKAFRSAFSYRFSVIISLHDEFTFKSTHRFLYSNEPGS